MNKMIKCLALIITTACVFLIMAVPAFAATGNGWYNQGTPTSYTNPIKVRVVLNSRKQGTDHIKYIKDNVTLGTNNMTPTTFTVADVLTAFVNQQSAYQTVGTNFNIGVLYDFIDVNANITYSPTLYTPYVLFGNTYYYPLDGWMFRVNGKIPTSTSSNTNANGLDIAHTYVEDGDVISFYTDCPWKINNTVYSTYFISAHTTYAYVENDNVWRLTIQLKKANDYYEGPLDTATWTIKGYTSYNPSGNNTATVRAEDGTLVGTVQLSSGHGTLNCTLDANTKYYVSVDDCEGFHTITGIDASGNSTSVDHLERTIAYDKVNH